MRWRQTLSLTFFIIYQKLLGITQFYKFNDPTKFNECYLSFCSLQLTLINSGMSATFYKLHFRGVRTFS